MQYRLSVGTFNAISIKRKFCRGRNERSTESSPEMLKHVTFLSRLFFGLFTAFSYSSMVILFLPLSIFLYPYTKFSEYNRSFCDNSLVKYFAHVICIITTLPSYISIFFRTLPSLLKSHFSDEVKNMFFFFLVLQILLVISGSVEINPGPSDPKLKNLSFAVWNLDSLPAREFARIPLIEGLQSTYDFDIFGICESMLTDKISNEEISINGFSSDPFRADKAVNVRNGGVCLYFKESLPIKQRCDLQKLPETIVAEIKLKKKKIFFVLSYRHPNMTANEVDTYMKRLEKIYEFIRKENPFVFILCGDFNARSPVVLGR